MKLWQKGDSSVAAIVESFTVGRDKEFDLLLAKYDVKGSIAHVTMLGQAGLMTREESEIAVKHLKEIAGLVEEGKFIIEEGVEDVHSQVEFMLTNRIGDIGRKIHSGRSRNDQVAVDIKLFLKDALLHIKNEVKSLFDLLLKQGDKYKDDLLPGYTHFQLAMPSSFGLWFGAYAESLVDDLEMLAAAYHVTNKNPLGSGAGYGSSFPLDRKLTTELLGFADLNYNSVYAQMSRGKTEKLVAMGISCIAASLSRMSMDCCLYMNQNFGFISFPSELTTGSSIMPHKKNPDVFEIIRARCNRIQSVPNELTILLNNLPSGYHRDVQLTKEILFPAISDLGACIELMKLMLSSIEVKKDLLKDDQYKYLFTVEAVNSLVNKGISFREAYQIVGREVEEGKFAYQPSGLEHTHEGSIGNLSLDGIRRLMDGVLGKFG
jgi:argininosuccinate lyase